MIIMPMTQYRPLEYVKQENQSDILESCNNGSIYRLNVNPTRNFNRNQSIKRKYLAFLLLLSALLIYIVWFSLVATTESKIDLVYSDSLQNVNVVNESVIICAEQFEDNRLYIQNNKKTIYNGIPVIYFVTPTYPRREQIPELTRLGYTLMHVPRLHWIVANDHNVCNSYLDFLLRKFGIPFTHISSPMPDIYRKKKPMPRGVSNRRAAMQWLKQRNTTQGILYFGDDDNTYDLKLFSEIRSTNRVSMFPVGLIEQYSVSGPVVRKGKIVGFLDSWVADRHWPVDMAGFAVNLHFMSQHPNASMLHKAGYEEDFFLRSIGLRFDLIEPKAKNCTEILVWHTQTKTREAPVIRIKNEYLDDRSNLGALFSQLNLMGVARTSNKEGSKAIISKNGKARQLEYFLS